MNKDLYSTKSIPSRKHCQDVSKNYFNTQSLFIELNQYCENNGLTSKIIVSDCDCEDTFEVVNKDFREKIRKFNNSIFYLTNSLFNFTYYYKLWKDCKAEEEGVLLCLWCRYEARYVCCELYMYVEKVKDILRNLFRLDKHQTKENDKLMKALNKCAEKNVYLREFCEVANRYHKDENVKFVNDIRNDEIHNESSLDNYTDKIEICAGQYVTTNPIYVIKNIDLYNKIKLCLTKLFELKQSLQKIIDNFLIE